MSEQRLLLQIGIDESDLKREPVNQPKDEKKHESADDVKTTLSSSSINCQRVKDEDCKLLPPPKFLNKPDYPLTSLSSFPGSGNTWFRILVTSLTGE